VKAVRRMVAPCKYALPMPILLVRIEIANAYSRNQMSSAAQVYDAVARRAAFAGEVQARTGIDEDMIRRLVHAFYSRVRADGVLRPIFDARISDWEPHLARMCAFWSFVTLMTGRYHGRPMQAHAPLSVDAGHFDRWLALFMATAQEVCPASAAEYLVEKARIIAESLQLGIATHRGLMLANGERLPEECPV
jgi:hemoglobin